MGCSLSTFRFWKTKPARDVNNFPEVYIPLPRREPIPDFPVLQAFHENPSTANMSMYEEDNWRPYYEGRATPPIGYSGIGRAPSTKGKKTDKGKGKAREPVGSAENENTGEKIEGSMGESSGGALSTEKKKGKRIPDNMEVIAEDDNE